MMHINAHCAHSVQGAIAPHVHIPPKGDVRHVRNPNRELPLPTGQL
jgi:hypothetical protein